MTEKEMSEKYQAVVEAAKETKQFAGHLKEDGTYWVVEKLLDALTALEEDV